MMPVTVLVPVWATTAGGGSAIININTATIVNSFPDMEPPGRSRGSAHQARAVLPRRANLSLIRVNS